MLLHGRYDGWMVVIGGMGRVDRLFVFIRRGQVWNLNWRFIVGYRGISRIGFSVLILIRIGLWVVLTMKILAILIIPAYGRPVPGKTCGVAIISYSSIRIHSLDDILNTARMGWHFNSGYAYPWMLWGWPPNRWFGGGGRMYINSMLRKGGIVWHHTGRITVAWVALTENVGWNLRNPGGSGL